MTSPLHRTDDEEHPWVPKLVNYLDTHGPSTCAEMGTEMFLQCDFIKLVLETSPKFAKQDGGRWVLTGEVK